MAEEEAKILSGNEVSKYVNKLLNFITAFFLMLRGS